MPSQIKKNNRATKLKRRGNKHHIKKIIHPPKKRRRRKKNKERNKEEAELTGTKALKWQQIHIYQYFLKCQCTECSYQRYRVAECVKNKNTRSYNILPTRDPLWDKGHI